DELWPLPKVGKCQCLSGYCDNTDGKCKVTATFPGSSASTYTSFGRLYDADADEKVPAEDIVPSEDIGSDGSTPSLVQCECRVLVAKIRKPQRSAESAALHVEKCNESNGTMPGATLGAPFEMESPWPEDYFPELTVTESQAKSGIPMVRYSGCRRCSEEVARYTLVE
ncbi:unnamed protein product, partial [Symbiodinium necroappetens]